jgi:hypothetical protein
MTTPEHDNITIVVSRELLNHLLNNICFTFDALEVVNQELRHVAISLGLILESKGGNRRSDGSSNSAAIEVTEGSLE